MKHKAPSETRRLADEVAELDRLDLSALKQRWQMLYRTEAPVRLGRGLLLDREIRALTRRCGMSTAR
jgi:hypothetical protein